MKKNETIESALQKLISEHGYNDVYRALKQLEATPAEKSIRMTANGEVEWIDNWIMTNGK